MFDSFVTEGRGIGASGAEYSTVNVSGAQVPGVNASGAEDSGLNTSAAGLCADCIGAERSGDGGSELSSNFMEKQNKPEIEQTRMKKVQKMESRK